MTFVNIRYSVIDIKNITGIDLELQMHEDGIDFTIDGKKYKYINLEGDDDFVEVKDIIDRVAMQVKEKDPLWSFLSENLFNVPTLSLEYINKDWFLMFDTHDRWEE